ncbi:hypothetical protein HII12_005471 [Brettanomyces bruxellensis]|uniref:G-patch domain-containing protein n=1 Tax=Dekkera bruxellensis TaxID=5007 RepID=A0A8H6B630_DEKBR|nr:hypothetical protein HII12_005471 [Brettanomyces bruxellensis]
MENWRKRPLSWVNRRNDKRDSDSDDSMSVSDNNEDEKPIRFSKGSSFVSGDMLHGETESTSDKLKTTQADKNLNDASVAPEYMKYGIGAKMMKQMGYVEGQGLGKTGQGIKEPIMTKLRPKGIGLGAIKEKIEESDDDSSMSESERLSVKSPIKKLNFQIQALPTLFELITALEDESFHVPQRIKEISDNSDQENSNSNRELRLLLEDVLWKIRDINRREKYYRHQIQEYDEYLQNTESKIGFAEFVIGTVEKSRAENDEFDKTSILKILHVINQEAVDRKIKIDSQVTDVLISMMAPTVKELLPNRSLSEISDASVINSSEPEQGDISAFDNMILQFWIPKVTNFFHTEWISISQPNLGISLIDDFASTGLVNSSGANFVLRSVIVPILIDDINNQWIIDYVDNADGPEIWIVDWLEFLPEDMLEEIMKHLFRKYCQWITDDWNLENDPVLPSQRIHLNLWLDYYDGKGRIEQHILKSIIAKLVNELREYQGDSFQIEEISNYMKYVHFIEMFRKNGLSEAMVNLIVQNEIMIPFTISFFKLKDDAQRFRFLSIWVGSLFSKVEEFQCVKDSLVICYDYLNLKYNTGISRKYRILAELPSISQLESQMVHPMNKFLQNLEKCDTKSEGNQADIGQTNRVTVTMKMLTEEYCEKHGMFLIPLRNEGLNETGKVMFEATTDMVKGVHVYFEDDILWAEVSEKRFEPIDLEELNDLVAALN